VQKRADPCQKRKLHRLPNVKPRSLRLVRGLRDLALEIRVHLDVRRQSRLVALFSDSGKVRVSSIDAELSPSKLKHEIPRDNKRAIQREAAFPFILRPCMSPLRPEDARAIDRSILRSARGHVPRYVYRAESIATAVPEWNTRYGEMRYGRLIREIRIGRANRFCK